ncbi:MAG: DNA oxidative demethylase AlkB [Polaromonas sp.]|uniref:DNA oxidative demethylase AlkB n=1 Tax=Polaromonas sp. TaxID=1869339 RepID=UPI0025E2CFE9|nr:DNA oxidative demethylase AlkB [Polaromonas sp.]MBI2725023.1 DNA oxidative demethylase AlkB [Polaromonas sp.]
MTADLFDDQSPERMAQPMAPGAMLLHGFALDMQASLLAAFEEVIAQAPLRHLVTPGGYTMSVAMTNCGALGWVSDRRGYRYQETDPLSGQPWPQMPDAWRELAVRAATEAGYADFKPDACLVNSYQPGAKLSLHQDRDEADMAAPIVSVSLGLPATFLFGTERRADKPQRYRLLSGDVVVWGGASRLAYHGIAQLPDGGHALTARRRINLTFRKAV